MANTIYAIFSDPAMAEKAAGALLDHGVRAEDLSLLRKHDGDINPPNLEFHAHESSERETFHKTRDYPEADLPRGASSGMPQHYGSVPDTGLDPGPYSGSVGAFAPVGGLGSTGAAAPFDEKQQGGFGGTYQGATTEDQNRKGAIPATDSMADEPVRLEDATNSGRSSVGPTAESDVDVQEDQVRNRETMTHGDEEDIEAAAKKGITTTTAADAGVGAVKGSVVGLGVGAVAALTSLLVPGVGLVVGGGALAVAIGGMVASAGAGAAAGAVTGYLKDQGVHDEHIRRYDGAISDGGALLSLHLPSNDVDETKAMEILSKYGAADVNSYTGASKGYMS